MQFKDQSMTKLAIVIAILLLAGCANPNLVGTRGNKLNSDYSLQDRRAAKLHIKSTKELPQGAQSMGDFSVERCHQYAQDQAPSETVLADDLMLLAYAEGADGLTNLRFSRESGLLKNCWFVAKGTATFFKTSK
jgi:outer membrane murein-binding lipoprotein Lpp